MAHCRFNLSSGREQSHRLFISTVFFVASTAPNPTFSTYIELPFFSHWLLLRNKSDYGNYICIDISQTQILYGPVTKTICFSEQQKLLQRVLWLAGKSVCELWASSYEATSLSAMPTFPPLWLWYDIHMASCVVVTTCSQNVHLLDQVGLDNPNRLQQVSTCHDVLHQSSVS